MYWLAIALRRLARQPLAVKALDSASQLTPRGYIRRSFLAITNGYGQPKCLCEEHDDYRAFFTIQVRRYLATVPGQKFFDATEMEAVLGIIAKAWLGLQRQPDAAGWSCGQKLEFFKNIRVVFPVLRNRVSGSGQQVISFINGLPKLGSVKIRRLPMPWEDRI
ncbi:MAG: hypothetical protein A2087_07785 [Spirochaetes bacterium GWD1_61_31]|nr:MAG: hypothetical protein A2004_13065 [Spirochaetes bacterium GWC1_61_12]OHD40231.1 MAG: hypothetical protein A2087_07785 [Spirochaetes bacterium GWD1_61_31]OHD59877.1 MAG: hypothetical protein A2Y32_00065 [Spirochaetes bacterium GWF1_60_12]HBO41980.1 hypothetical protein [Spirochaetaceae bacterium]